MKRQETIRSGLAAGCSVLILIGLSACASNPATILATKSSSPAQAETPGAKSRSRLKACPDSPNCVSTLSPQHDNIHYIAPLSFSGDVTAAKSRLLAIINKMPRTKIIVDKADYLHVEFRSRLFRFVDDVEFVMDEAAQLIHFRSASRLGYGDMGVNRKRMEEIRAQFVRVTH